MDTQAYWKGTSPAPEHYGKLNDHLEADVVIVGGGITGLTAAHELLKTGRSVILLEARAVASGTTGNSTGNLYTAVQSQYRNICDKFDDDKSKAVAASRQAAIDYIERTVNTLEIDCAFTRRPWYMFCNHNDSAQKLEDEIEAMERASIPVQRTDAMPLKAPFVKAALVENQARLNPFKYVRGLADEVVKQGARIFEHSPIEDIREDSDTCRVRTAQGSVKAEAGIIATHIPKGFNPLQLLVFPHRSYVVAAKLEGDDYPNGNFWDMDGSYHAISTHGDTADALDLMMVAGKHHKTGQAPDHAQKYRELETYVQRNYPACSIAYRWSAQHYVPADGIPYIGKSTLFSRRLYTATGFGTDGLTYGTLAGRLLADRICETDNPWAKVYDAERITPMASTREFLKENANVFSQYLKDYVGKGAKAYTEIGKGEAKIVDGEDGKLAVYRDDKNRVHAVSAICTHLKCVVRWNNAEKSWDCPCHGSRFAPDGEVIEGPALKPLERADRTDYHGQSANQNQVGGSNP